VPSLSCIPESCFFHSCYFSTVKPGLCRNTACLGFIPWKPFLSYIILLLWLFEINRHNEGVLRTNCLPAVRLFNLEIISTKFDIAGQQEMLSVPYTMLQKGPRALECVKCGTDCSLLSLF